MDRIKHSLVPALLVVVIAGAAASGLSLLGRNARPVALAAVDAVAEPAALDREPISPLPRSIDLDTRKLALGRRLFHDPRLSADNRVSCASCHNVARNGADDRSRSTGVGGASGEVNAPTVFNSALNFRQFWDGRAETLEDQIEGPIHNLSEMATDWPPVLDKLRADPEYVSAFRAIYAQKIDILSVKDAIATFERSLVTPDSRFDRYLRGNSKALSVQEQEGYRLFKENGCSSCHQGVLAGGNMFEKFGIVGDYFRDRGNVTKADLGRYNVTGRDEDRYRFKVPGLRNVARTAPYFHDGSAQSLEEAVEVMARYQLGRQLSANDLQRIVQFLETLNGTLPGANP